MTWLNRRSHSSSIPVVPLGSFAAAFQGCPLHFANRLVFVDFVIVIVTESVMLGLLVLKAIEQCTYLTSVTKMHRRSNAMRQLNIHVVPLWCGCSRTELSTSYLSWVCVGCSYYTSQELITIISGNSDIHCEPRYYSFCSRKSFAPLWEFAITQPSLVRIPPINW